MKTIRQRAEEYVGPHLLEPARELTIAGAEVALAAAIAAEREACARIAEAPHHGTRGGGPADPQRIAAAIRARVYAD